MSKIITIPVNEMIPAGSSIQLIINEAGKFEPVFNEQNASFVLNDSERKEFIYGDVYKQLPTDDTVLQSILNNGYVKNTNLHRRWVMAQYLRALQSPSGYYGYINSMSYMESFKKMIEEVRVLSRLEESGDTEAFSERKSFFTAQAVRKIVNDYMYEVQKYINDLPIKCCKKRPYKTINGKGNVFVDDLETKIYHPLDKIVFEISRAATYVELYDWLRELQRLMVKLPDDTHKSKAWKNAYQASGAYYTLKNMIMYHNCRLPIYENDDIYIGMFAERKLKALLGTYKGFQYHALLKRTLEINNFDYVERMREIGVREYKILK